MNYQLSAKSGWFVGLGNAPIMQPKQNLLILLDSVLYNVGLKPRSTISALKRSASAHQLPAKDIVFGISGMSCTSCALFLEMVLQRNPEINRASVNYVSEIARINSYLSKEALFKQGLRKVLK